MPDLTLISTSDLLDELMDRHDSSIFASFQNRTDKEMWYMRRWQGGNIPCLGLARFIQRRIEEACDEMDVCVDEPPE